MKTEEKGRHEKIKIIIGSNRVQLMQNSKEQRQKKDAKAKKIGTPVHKTKLSHDNWDR
jgi:hypothetical protein